MSHPQDFVPFARFERDIKTRDFLRPIKFSTLLLSDKHIRDRTKTKWIY